MNFMNFIEKWIESSLVLKIVIGLIIGVFLLIPMCFSLFEISADISMQVVAVGFIISVIQDSCGTALNYSGDPFFTATAEYCNRVLKYGAY